MSKKSTISKRYDMVLLFDVAMGNPNGDPDAGNMPRQISTGHGVVTDVALKRKVRNFLQMLEGSDDLKSSDFEDKGVDILIKLGSDKTLDKVYGDIRLAAKKGEDVRSQACDSFIDARLFGCVMTGKDVKGKKCSNPVHGPVQFEWAKSIDPILPEQACITKCVASAMKSKPKKKDAVDDADEAGSETGRMGNKWIVPYALYRSHIFVSPAQAGRLGNGTGFKGTGMTQKDLRVLLKALLYMFEVDRSAARGRMATQRLIVFKHPNQYGVARAEDLFKLVKVDPNPEAKCFDDYAVTIDAANLPEGVKVHEITMDGKGGCKIVNVPALADADQ